ncbi:transposase [Dyella aluminiiresistens]|uniref:transposase n=1 Tax=Dyella aluminiiresistens TaxID=3069105 RepID=UPI00399C615C
MDACWTKKHGKSYYGHKLHASTDRRWGFIRRIEVTATSVNDTEVFEAILDETNTAKDVYADRGYAKHAQETELYVQGYRAHIQRKGTATQPISDAQQRRNRRIARQRARTPVRASGADGRQAPANDRPSSCSRRDRTEGDRPQPDASGAIQRPGRGACMMRAGRSPAADALARAPSGLEGRRLPILRAVRTAICRSHHAKGWVIRGARLHRRAVTLQNRRFQPV